MSQKRSSAKPASSMVVSIIKGALVGSILSIGLVLLLALALKNQWLDMTAAPLMNSLIKVISAAVASLVATIRCTGKKWLTGGIAGAAYALVAFLVFSLLSGGFELRLSLLTDIGIGLLAGILISMLLQIIKK